MDDYSSRFAELNDDASGCIESEWAQKSFFIEATLLVKLVYNVLWD